MGTRRRALPVRGEGTIPPVTRAPHADGPRPEHADPGGEGFVVPDLPSRPSLEYLRKLAKARKRDRSTSLSRAQFEIAREYGFDSWPKLVHHVRTSGLAGIERALVRGDAEEMAAVLRADPPAATAPVGGLPPLLALLRRSAGTAPGVRECARLLLDAGADPDSHTVEGGGEWRRTALFDAVERRDLALVRLLVERGATRDEDAFYHACEQSDTAYLDLLYQPDFAGLVVRKLDFEDAAGLRWFLDRGVDVDAYGCLHHAIFRGRGLPIITMLLDAGADPNRPWHRWDVGRRPLALAARCGHLAAFDLLAARGATADLDEVDRTVLAVARGESVELPGDTGSRHSHVSWLLGQFAGLGRTDVVRALLDAGMPVDTRGWSNFTPLDQAAMHGRAQTVQLLLDRGADVDDRAFDDEGPTPLDCALWGLRNNHADDGDYVATVAALVAVDAPTRHRPPTGDEAIDALLARYAVP
jgi:hypothetical protein